MINETKFGGTWKLLNSEKVIPGELHACNDMNEIILELTMASSDEKAIPRAPYSGKIPYIWGNLFNGKRVMLYDCSTGQESHFNLMYTKQIIYARYAFWDLDIEHGENIKLKRVQFDFGNLIQWTELCELSWSNMGEDITSLRWFKKKPVTLDMNDNLSIIFYPTFMNKGFVNYKEEVIVKQKVRVEFQYEEAVSWDNILSDVKSMEYLIGLALNRIIDVRNVTYQLTQDTEEYREITLGTGKKYDSIEDNVNYSLFMMEDLINTKLLDKWKLYYPKLRPVLDLYFTGYSKSLISPEIHFLNLMQALETFHSRMITNNPREYKIRVQEIVNNYCKDTTSIETQTNFLLSEHQNQNKHYVELRSRLADLIFAEGIRPFHPEIYEIDEYLDKMVNSRNYYTHYNESRIQMVFTQSELPWINKQLLTLLEYHILVLIGIDALKVKEDTVRKNEEIFEMYTFLEGTHQVDDIDRSMLSEEPEY